MANATGVHLTTSGRSGRSGKLQAQGSTFSGLILVDIDRLLSKSTDLVGEDLAKVKTVAGGQGTSCFAALRCGFTSGAKPIRSATLHWL